MLRLEVIRGASAKWTVQGQRRSIGGVPVGFLASDALSTRVWSGDDQAVLATLAASWVDASTCQVKVAATADDTAAMEPASYRIQILSTRDLDVTVIADAVLVIQPAPGLADPLPVYCTAADLRRECGWIDQIMNFDADQSGFAEQRAEAREWLDGLVVNAYPGGGRSQTFPGVMTANYDGGLRASPWLMGILAADRVVLTGPRGKGVVRTCSYYALARIFESCLGPGNQFAQYGAGYAKKANAAAASLVVEISVNGDGVSDLTVPLCVTRTRRG